MKAKLRIGVFVGGMLAALGAGATTIPSAHLAFLWVKDNAEREKFHAAFPGILLVEKEPVRVDASTLGRGTVISPSRPGTPAPAQGNTPPGDIFFTPVDSLLGPQPALPAPTPAPAPDTRP